MRTKMSIQMAERQVDVLVTRRLVTCSLLPTWSPPKSGNFFTLTDELFYLNLDHGPITVYAYLLYCEDHRTHQSHPSYKTISTATGLAVNTVMKHISELENRQFISVERTSYIDSNGTLLPILQAADGFYQWQMTELELIVERQRVAGLLREQESPA